LAESPPPRPATATPEVASLLANALAPLREYPAFRRLWWSTLFASSAWWAQTVVLAWLAFDLTQSELAVAAFGSVGFAPFLAGPFGGLLADRVHRPRLLLGSQIVALGAGVAIAALVSFDLAAYWHVLAAGFVVGLMQAPLQPTRFTLIMDLVGARHLSSANAVNATGLLGSRVIVPALAGALIAGFGPGVALWFSAAFDIPACLPLAGMPDAARAAARSTARPFDDLLRGVRFVLGSRALLGVLLVTVAANSFGWPIVLGFLPVFAEEVLEVGAGGLGLLVGVNGLGALIGAIGIATLGDFQWKGRLYLGGTALFGLGLAGFAVSGGLGLALVLVLVAGLGSAGFGVMQSTITLMLAPEDARGRVLGVLMLSIGVLPLAMLVQGAVASATGVAATTLVSGLLLGAAMAAVAIAVPELRQQH
jgi:MFS family permease